LNTRRALCTLGLALTVWGLGADTVGDRWPDPHTVRVAPSELAFEDAEYGVNTTDSVFLVAQLNDGWTLMANYFEIRNPLFRRWGVYTIVSTPQGRGYWYKEEIRDREVRTDPRRLYVSDGRNTILSESDGYHVVLDVQGFSCDLWVANTLPPWKGGDGVDPLRPDGRLFASRVVAVPWGEVSGTMAMGGRTLQVRGQGVLDKALVVTPLSRLDPLIYSVRAFSPEETSPVERWFVEFLDTTAHEAFGSVRRSSLVVAHSGEWMLATPAYTLEASDYQKVGSSPYLAPRTLRISARQDGYELHAVYRAASLFNMTDVIDEVPRWVRPIVAAFVRRPVYYRFLGVLEGTLTHPDGHMERLVLEGPYEYVVTR
jgi:hypothetical protein